MRLRRFLGDVIEKAGGPKAVALELKRLGFEGRDGQFDDRTIRAWRTGGRMPTPEIVFALAARYEVSLDGYVFGAALEEKFADRLLRQGRELEQQSLVIAWLTGRLQELALRTGHGDMLAVGPPRDAEPDEERAEA